MFGFFVVYIAAFVVYGTIGYHSAKHERAKKLRRFCRPPEVSKSDTVFTGSTLELDDEEVHTILSKRFSYYKYLSPGLQHQFRQRLTVFMCDRIFIIKGHTGFREMPVLVSAAAIQLTLGLSDFRLPFYRHVRIYPKEYISDDFMKVLAGNVHHNTISIAWNHLLDGYSDAEDGANVGLHEMSHALYCQKIEIEKSFSKGFTRKFNELMKKVEKAAMHESSEEGKLYSAYADKNLEEFWAESIELFFERPEALAQHHPEVFDGLKMLLNQNPINKTNPVIKKRRDFIVRW